MMRTLSLLALSTLTALVVSAGSLPRAEAAPVPKHLMKNGENPDLAVLQGTWEISGRSFQGRPMAITKTSAGNTIEFQGDKVIMTTGSTKRQTVATAKLELNSKPRRIILTYESTVPGAAPRTVTQIYKIEDGELIMAPVSTIQGPNGEKAPADFKDIKTVITSYKKAAK